MALVSPSQPHGDDQDRGLHFTSQEALSQGNRGDDTVPLLDYKRLETGVARQIAPDLQETLEHTLQVSLGKIQNHSGES